MQVYPLCKEKNMNVNLCHILVKFYELCESLTLKIMKSCLTSYMVQKLWIGNFFLGFSSEKSCLCWCFWEDIIVKKFVQGVQLVNNCCNRNSKKSYFHLWKFLVFLFMLLFIPSLTNYKSYGTSPYKNKCWVQGNVC